MTNEERNTAWRLHRQGFPPDEIAVAIARSLADVQEMLRDPSPEEITMQCAEIRARHGLMPATAISGTNESN